MPVLVGMSTLIVRSYYLLAILSFASFLNRSQPCIFAASRRSELFGNSRRAHRLGSGALTPAYPRAARSKYSPSSALLRVASGLALNSFYG
jgi:hypothetical protein